MNYFDKYKQVNLPYGNTQSEHTINYSTQAALRTFLNSPTLSTVKVNEVEGVKSIVSVYSKDFFDRTFLFEPNSEHAKVGQLITHKNYIYLVLKSNDNEIYPNLYGKICNETFSMPNGYKDEIVNTTRGTTIKRVFQTIEIPVVIDLKGYSVVDNAVLPLAEGRVIIYTQYRPEYLEHLKLNYEFEILNDNYKISDIQTDKIINGEGYLVLSAQKVSENIVN